MTISQAASVGASAAIILFGAGCSSEMPAEADPIIRFSLDSLPIHRLQGHPLEADSLGLPAALMVGQEYVLVGDVGGGSPLIVFDRQSGEVVASGGRFGQAPGELGGLRDIIPVAGQDAAWIFDFRGRSMQYVDIDRYVLTRTLPDKRLLLNTGPGDPHSPVWAPDSTIICSGTYGSARFSVFAADGTFLRKAGPPPPGADEQSLQVRHQVYSAVLRSRPNGKWIAAAFDRSDRLEIYEGTDLRHIVRGPDLIEPAFTARTNPDGVERPDYSDEYRHGYESISVNDQTIFGLYSGKSLAESPTGEDAGSYVLAFAWDGQPLAALHVGEAPQRIAVSEDGSDLYVAFWLPSPQIKRYSLPDLTE